MPRLLNILSHKALLAVFGEGKHTVRLRHVRLAVADTEGASAPGWW
jgi:MSHA biogenesis protein MshM